MLVVQTTNFSGISITGSSGTDVATFTPAVDSLISIMTSLTGLSSAGAENIVYKLRYFDNAGTPVFRGRVTGGNVSKEATTDTVNMISFGGSTVPLCPVFVPAGWTLHIALFGSSTNASGTCWVIDMNSATEVRNKVLGGGADALTGYGVIAANSGALVGSFAVAFLFGLLMLVAAPKTLSAGSTANVDAAVLDATFRTTTDTSASVGTQWQASPFIQQHDPSGVDPNIGYASSDAAKAIVGSDGLVTYVSDGTFNITASTAATADSPARSVEKTLTNSHSTVASNVTHSYIGDALDVTKHVLVVINGDDANSVALGAYYLANRPLMSTANVLTINCGAASETINYSNYQSQIETPVANWITANPTKPLRYIVGCMLPNRTTGTNYATTYILSQIRKTMGSLPPNSIGQFYKNGTARYTAAQYAWTTICSNLNAATLADAKAYIDKLKACYDATNPGSQGIIISGADGGKAGTKWVFDDVRNSQYSGTTLVAAKRDAVLAEGVPGGNVTYAPYGAAHVTSAADVVGYCTWGVNGALASTYATDGTIVFTGKSGWYLIDTIESFNGDNKSTQPVAQGNYQDHFSATAFGGTSYAHTPVFGVYHVYEPGTPGINSETYHALFARGWTAGEAGFNSVQTPYLLAIGDPMVRL